MTSCPACKKAATRDKVAEAIYRACHSEWRGFIPRSIELRYGRMADAAITEIDRLRA
jgi:hypothetical protein